MSRDQGDKDRRLGGYVLIVCGALVALLSGACSISALQPTPPDYPPSVANDLGIVMIFGGVPFLGGVCLIFAGFWMLRRKPPGRGSS